MEPNTQTLANSLAETIRQRIVTERLAEGDLFLTEAEVVEQYSVSRNIAREAVSQLRALGVLKSRQAKGLVVARSSPVELLARSLPFFARSPAEFRQLAEWRFTLEIGAVDLAVSNATAAQVARLSELADEYDSLYRDDPLHARSDEIELAFHCLILEMTGNPLIAGMYQVLAEYFAAAAEQPWHPAGATENAAWQHRAIALAFRQRDLEQARALLRQHLHPMYHLPDEDNHNNPADTEDAT